MEYSALPWRVASTLLLIEFMKILLLLLLASGPALDDDASVLRCRTIGDAGQRLACYDALPVGAAPRASTANAYTPAPSARAMEQAFGVTPEKKEKEQQLKSFSSTIPGRFDGLAPNQQIVLANGQVWRIIDDSSAPVSGINLKVKVERNFVGTTFMVIEGTNTAPKVKRIK